MTRRVNDPPGTKSCPIYLALLRPIRLPSPTSGLRSDDVTSPGSCMCVGGSGVGGPALVPSPSHRPTSTAQCFPAISSLARRGRWSESSALASCGITWGQWLCVELQKRLRAWHSGLAAWKRGRRPRPALAAASPTLGLHQPSALLTRQSHCVLSTSPGPLTIENVPGSGGCVGLWGRDP